MRPRALLSLLVEAEKIRRISIGSDTIDCKVNFVLLFGYYTQFELAVVEQ